MKARVFWAVGLALAVAFLLAPAAWGGTTERVSVASDGTEGNDWSATGGFSITADGRLVVFESWATNLVPDDTNGFTDIFIHDRETHQTTRITMGLNGEEPNEGSLGPEITPDGRFIRFVSFASNLVTGDTNGCGDIFVYDVANRAIERVSVATDGTEGDDLSGGGTLSADGRFVAFYSYASNLVADDTNGVADVFVRDRATGQTTRVSIASDGTQANGSSVPGIISADGESVAFSSSATNLVEGDTNGVTDTFVHEISSGLTTRVSVASDGTEGNKASAANYPAISADGQFVAFYSEASNLVPIDKRNYTDVFVHDRASGQTTMVSVASDGTQGNNSSRLPCISADGRYVAFTSYASNLVPGDRNRLQDAFVHDRQTGETTRVSVASDGTQADSQTRQVKISATGRFVAFCSAAGNLVPSDTNGGWDLFVHDCGAPPALAITTDSLPDAVLGQDYTASLTAIGGTAPYLWSILEGVLPVGLTLDGATGAIAGIPSTEETQAFTVQVVDDAGDTDTRPLSIAVRTAPAVTVTVVSVTARDIREGGKYGITATVRNDGVAAVTIHADCLVDGPGGSETLDTRTVSIDGGASVPVRFNDTSTIGAGACTATVTVQEDPDVGSSNTAAFTIK